MDCISEQYFKFSNMSEDENVFYLNLLKNCKDIDKFNIVEVSMVKNDDVINFNGSIHNDIENRCIFGYIYLRKNIKVVMDVTRLMCANKNSYCTCDIFDYSGKRLYSRYYYEEENIKKK